MALIDTHAHLEELKDLDGSLARAEETGVEAVITMGMDYESNLWALEESFQHQREGLSIYPAVGVHPWSLDASKIDANIQLIEENASEAVAVGEIGLDYWYKEVRKNPERKAQQRELFRRLLAIAKKSGKPVSIHSRGAWLDCADIVIETGVKNAVFHWFSGSLDVLKRLLDQGCYVSATPAAAYSKEHRAAVENAPLDRLLLETDSPVAYRGEPSEPATIFKALTAVAELKDEKQEKVAEVTTENARLVFRV
ncbi:MAG: TatD family hydrolase [Candidatus Bathyarchaeota archaeon]|nr:TatD family hydrolase [Candidatus Bathyarchaeota archaeon]